MAGVPHVLPDFITIIEEPGKWLLHISLLELKASTPLTSGKIDSQANIPSMTNVTTLVA